MYHVFFLSFRWTERTHHPRVNGRPTGGRGLLEASQREHVDNAFTLQATGGKKIGAI